MRSLARLFGAFGTLADSVLALASVLNNVTDRLRLQLSAEVDPPALPSAGEVIEHAEPEASGTAANGRKRKTATV